MSKDARANVTGFGGVRRLAAAIVLSLIFALNWSPAARAQAANPPAPGPDVTTEAQGSQSNADIWSAIRQGEVGKVSIPDRKAAQLIQSEGEAWRSIRNGPLTIYGSLALLATILLLALFFLLRGRVRIEHGWSGITIERFTLIERFGHWLMAGSFIVLALTGLNILFGRHVLMPVIGKPAFAAITQWGKYAHDYVSFAFMLGVVMIFIMWVLQNIPGLIDLQWLAKGGGIVGNRHPHARKFNAGQKIVFWLVVLGTISVSLSGLALMFPFQTGLMAKTFAFINIFGLDLPTNLSPVAEQQLNEVWHATVAIGFICVILGHIYIGTIGMEGAFDAMGTGQVDLNWAREHHDLWAAEVEERVREGERDARVQPAE